MDEPNQMQMPEQQIGPTPMPSMSPMAVKNKSIWLWVVIVIALVVAGAAWWYINQTVVEPVVQQQPPINLEAREDITISKDIQSTDSVNLDSEFKTIDNDISGL